MTEYLTTFLKIGNNASGSGSPYFCFLSFIKLIVHKKAEIFWTLRLNIQRRENISGHNDYVCLCV